jgi:hypothetical protein
VPGAFTERAVARRSDMPTVRVSKHRLMAGRSATCVVCRRPLDDRWNSEIPKQRHLCAEHEDYTVAVFDAGSRATSAKRPNKP